MKSGKFSQCRESKYCWEVIQCGESKQCSLVSVGSPNIVGSPFSVEFSQCRESNIGGSLFIVGSLGGMGFSQFG